MSWTRKQIYLAAGGAAVVVLGAYAFVWKRALTPGNYPFAYRDAEWLAPGQKFGGLAHVPPGALNHARLLVYLHGNNNGGMLHGGMGAADTPYDLRAVVPPDTIVAAPSQTRNASGAGLWAGFDLDAFVAAVEQATGATIDRSEVVLMGHSGAGCSLTGGLLGKLGTIRPALVAAVDVCAGPGYGEAFGKLGEQVPVRVFYQTASWPRDFAGFRAALRGRATLEEIKTPPGQSPHAAIVPLATRLVLA